MNDITFDKIKKKEKEKKRKRKEKEGKKVINTHQNDLRFFHFSLKSL